MIKGLDLTKRQQPEIIDGFPTGNIFIGVTKEELTELEQALQDLDTIKELFSQYGLEYKLTSAREALLLLKQYQGSFGARGQALITKKLQALEIIEEKNVDIGLLKITKTVETYNKEIKKILFGYDDGKLTQEEYDLLKEVLVC